MAVFFSLNMTSLRKSSRLNKDSPSPGGHDPELGKRKGSVPVEHSQAILKRKKSTRDEEEHAKTEKVQFRYVQYDGSKLQMLQIIDHCSNYLPGPAASEYRYVSKSK